MERIKNKTSANKRETNAEVAVQTRWRELLEAVCNFFETILSKQFSRNNNDPEATDVSVLRWGLCVTFCEVENLSVKQREKKSRAAQLFSALGVLT
jgi:hypothetical protein